jgi:hypothetical protein
MKTLLITLPYLLSLPLGYILIELIFHKSQKPNPFVQLFLALGLGLSASASLTFFSFVFLNNLNKPLTIGAHVLLISLMFIVKLNFLKDTSSRWKDSSINPTNIILWGVLIVTFIPIWLQANHFPYGGWDAWAVWNFKAKFLFLAGDKWQNLFDPILWRSSQHYPLFLPLLNVWGWIFSDNTSSTVPLLTSLVFTFLTVGLLFSALLSSTKNTFSILAPLLLMTLYFYGKLATSQYSDLIVGYYALASLYCLTESIKYRRAPYAVLAGLFMGALSFSKPEGMMLALIILFSGTAVFLFDKKNTERNHTKLSIICLLAATLLALVPTIIFKIQYSPGNQTFVNGLLSRTNPSTIFRMKMAVAFLSAELKSPKWNGIWILLFLGMLLGYRRCFKKDIIIIPATLLIYLVAVLFYYFINTYFDISWWLSVTLNRILFSLLPITVFWIFNSILEKK